MLLGCIADDLTGATDLALILQRTGMRTVQVIGVPEKPMPQADAIVVALKSRTIPPDEAVQLSLASADALLSAGARQLFFKYCSTFDSTDAGNIGPVMDALMQRVDAGVTIACPAFPANGRTVYRGHLFVGDVLLSDSSMRDHPLTPMRDSNLVRVLARQSRLPVDLLPISVVEQGEASIKAAIEVAADRGGVLIADAITDRHLVALGHACADLPLITGGSALATGLSDNFRRAGLMNAAPDEMPFSAPDGRAVILAGSCSTATRGQVAHAISNNVPALRLFPDELTQCKQSPEAAVDWALEQNSAVPILIYSSADPREVEKAHQRLGRENAATIVEETLGTIAHSLAARGFTRFLVAGGETSGAVVAALGVRALAIGPEIDPGVPWTRSLDKPGVALALKSGNFGGSDFFLKAWDCLS